MKTNKIFRNFEDEALRGGQAKGKTVSLKEKKSNRSIYDEIEEDEETGYYSLRKQESVEDYFDEDEDEDLDDFGEEPGYGDDDFDEDNDEDYYMEDLGDDEEEDD